MIIIICAGIVLLIVSWGIFHKLHLHVQQCVDHGSIEFDGHSIGVSPKAEARQRPMLTREIRVLSGCARIMPGAIKLTPGKQRCQPVL